MGGVGPLGGGVAQCAANEPAGAAFHVQESRHGLHAELFGVRSVDAAHERLHQPIEGFAAESAADERAQAFVGDVAVGWHEVLGEQAEFARRLSSGVVRMGHICEGAISKKPGGTL